jgi:hypothetical protein
MIMVVVTVAACDMMVDWLSPRLWGAAAQSDWAVRGAERAGGGAV